MPPSLNTHGFTHVFIPPAANLSLSDITIVTLHGTGGDERALLPLAARVAPGAAVLSPRAGVLEHGMPRFFRRLAEGVFDLEDLAERTGQLGAFIDAAVAEHRRDRGRVVAVGFSNGANIAASLLLRQPDAFAAAALLRPMVPFEPEGAAPSPTRAPARVLIAAGRSDPLVPPDQPERLATLLRAAGCSTDVRWTAAGHQLVRDDLAWTSALVAEFAQSSPPSSAVAKSS